MTDRDDFVVDTEGRCFMCFRSVTLCQPSIHSLQFLSRYLEMELSSVFKEKGSISPHLLAKVEEARLKAELCERCKNLNGAFSKLIRKLDKIETEVGACVDLIHRTLLEAEGTAKLMDDGANGKLEIVKVLRGEAIKKCSDKLRFVKPRVGIKRLTRKQIHAEKSRNYSRNVPKAYVPEGHDKELATPEEIIWLKLEESKISDDEEDDRYFEVSEMHEQALQQLEVPMDYKVIPSCQVKTEDNTIQPQVLCKDNQSLEDMDQKFEFGQNENSNKLSVSVAASKKSRKEISKSKYSLNPQTGKYKCLVCSKEFRQQAFSNHYRTVHIKMRYKCTLCAKEFTQKSSFKDHYNNAHLHIKLNCQKCRKTFATKASLWRHRRYCRTLI